MHRRDSYLVGAFALLWIVALSVTALATGQSPWLLVATAFVWPLVVWSGFMGAVIYFHHTHPDVLWYSDPEQWEADRDGVSTTVHLTFPGRLGWVLNNIMTHPAHHLDVRIPLYRIDAAERALGACARKQPFSLAYAFDCMRRCKLYDYGSQRWMDFGGHYTRFHSCHPKIHNALLISDPSSPRFRWHTTWSASFWRPAIRAP